MHHLQREDAVEAGVEGPVDRGHAAGRDAGVDAVAAVEHAPDEGVIQGRIHLPILRGAPAPPVPLPRLAAQL
ncbi:hypothetical protein GCM10010371_28300 [Streptomyces subrutilus]|uniref:Uncharacterized protein n=1 Tax=Streptomyces subrutilus TaxID=36818 RepID=A0A918QT42_9ACTN|nr:hypothetical protein GCM10010371_28300 [Streptomyces subrutilus]